MDSIVEIQYKQLWIDAFGDSEEFLNDLFASRGYIISISEGSTLISALRLMPYTISFSDREVKSFYIYGLVTRPEYRKQGYASKLLSLAQARARAFGAQYCFLVAANERLEKYYLKQGFSKVISKLGVVYAPIEDVEKYNSMLPRPAVLHSEDDWRLVLKYNDMGVASRCQFISLQGMALPYGVIASCMLE